jgi:hypothetical protein
MPSPDEILPAALALHNSPRRYALLLGSGLSRDTGILTAREITDDLICQMAGDQIKRHQRPQEWYKETHSGAAPTFTNLFADLAPSDDDRKAILRQYFEPKGSDGQPQKIEPTPAHMSIARLVKEGIISMIITTNFDPLLEEAIKKETGRIPIVITYESDPRIMEVAGDPCRIVMINGRYPTTDLKLTPDDLASYNENLSKYLDRIFLEYGLIICGWSGEHDSGLVKILTAERIIRRFAIFWCSRELPEKIPDNIRTKLHLSTIGIRSANEFFEDLESRIEMLRRHERTTSLTVESAIKKVKDTLKESRPELTLSDLVNNEVNNVLDELNREGYVTGTHIDGKACYQQRLEDLEKVTAPLAAMVATIAYYDNENYGDIVSDAIERLINVERKDPFPIEDRSITYFSGEKLNYCLEQLRFYPALLVIYASGITAVKKYNLDTIEAILFEPSIRELDLSTVYLLPFFRYVNVTSVLGCDQHLMIEFNRNRFGTGQYMYYYPYRVVQSIVQFLIPNEIAYEAAFDVFEYIYGLFYLYRGGHIKSASKKNPPNALLTRMWVKTVGYDGNGRMVLPQSLRSYMLEIHSRAKNSKFFGQNFQQFELCNRDLAVFYEIDPPLTKIQLTSDVRVVN